MSAQSVSVLCLSMRLAGVVAACRFVTPARVQAGADGYTLGVARSAGALGEVVPIDVLGTAVVEAGAAIAEGATVKSDSTGRAITWATSGAKVGIALDAATAAGQLIEVLLLQNAA